MIILVGMAAGSILHFCLVQQQTSQEQQAYNYNNAGGGAINARRWHHASR